MTRYYQTVAASLFLSVVFVAASTTSNKKDFYHARGSQIMDSRDRPVKLAGVSWWGLETDNYAPLGLDKRPMEAILAQVKAMGFNTVRIPYSNAMLHNDVRPRGINYIQNPELQNLTSLQVMDRIIAGAHAHGLRVILDRHRPDENDQSDLWYTAQHSEQEWIDDWKMLARRYRNDDTVIGFDLHNEPHGKATWGTGDAVAEHPTDWRLAAERCGNEVLAINPHLLILVEGVSDVGSGNAKDSYWWGGNLSYAARYPVRLTHPEQLVYSAHDYPPSVADQGWFKDASYPANLPAVWQRQWGYLAEQNRVPVVLGEFGSHYSTRPDKQWMNQLVGYLSSKNISAMYWSLNPESGDTGGLLQADWRTIDVPKLNALGPILPGHAPASYSTVAEEQAPVAAELAASVPEPVVPTRVSQMQQAQQLAAQAAVRPQALTTASAKKAHGSPKAIRIDFEPSNPLGNAKLD